MFSIFYVEKGGWMFANRMDVRYIYEPLSPSIARAMAFFINSHTQVTFDSILCLAHWLRYNLYTMQICKYNVHLHFEIWLVQTELYFPLYYHYLYFYAFCKNVTQSKIKNPIKIERESCRFKLNPDHCIFFSPKNRPSSTSCVHSAATTWNLTLQFIDTV